MAGDFVMESWFYFLIGAIVLFKMIVIGGIIYVRKHNIFAKKSALPNIYGKHCNNNKFRNNKDTLYRIIYSIERHSRNAGPM